jgi:hypothetical protein
VVVVVVVVAAVGTFVFLDLLDDMRGGFVDIGDDVTETSSEIVKERFLNVIR